MATILTWTEGKHIGSADDISVHRIREFQNYFYKNHPLYKSKVRRKTLNAPATWDKYRLILSAFLNWCVQRDYASRNVLAQNKEFTSKIQQNLPDRILSPDKLKLLFARLEETRDLMMVTLFRTLAYTGCRMGEVLKLRWEDVDLKHNVIKVVRDTKNRKVRSIPIATNLRPHLEAISRTSGPVFASGSGQPVSHNWAYKVLQFALQDCSLPPARLHDFRHTFGASLAQQGVPISAIKELMGHSRITSTQIYIHFALIHLRQEIAKLPFEKPWPKTLA